MSVSSITRTLSFFSKWTAEIFRQPALMLSLVLGPFLVLLAFGHGVNIHGPRPRTLIVENASADSEMAPLPEQLDDHIKVVGTTTDMHYAREQLRTGKVDAVAVMPPDPVQTVKEGKHVPVHILTNEIDPVREGYARAYLREQVAELNKETITEAIAEAQGSATEIQNATADARPLIAALRTANGNIEGARTQLQQLQATIDPLAALSQRASTAMTGASFVVPGLERPADQAERLGRLASDLNASVDALDRALNEGGTLPTPEELDTLEKNLDEVDRLAADVQHISPEVLAAPFELQMEDIAPLEDSFTAFYAPAVLALLVQHLAVTLGALSMSRIRLIGMMDILRVSPVRAGEVVAGNYLSYGALCAVAAAALVALTVILLDVPVFGSWLLVAGALALLIAASLGVGFVVSMLSASEQQAAQLAMLILLCSIFFSGFVFALDRIAWPVRALSYVLPSTYAIRALQDVMLRGVLREPLDLTYLGLAAGLFLIGTLLLFKRELRPQ